PAFAAFRAFCLEQSTTIRQLVATRITQTNETRRCAYLLPAFQVVANISGQDLALLEIGPSAGLNMLWDRYHYDYNEFQVGDARSPVRITTELQGPTRPPIPDHPPTVAWRCGIEISPPDLGNADAVRWLEALIWPEKIERLTRLRAAIAMAQAAPPPIISGDALKLLPTFIAKAPSDTALCIYHTHVIYQFSPAMREQLDGILAIAGQTRPIYRLSCEGMDVEYPQLTLTINKGGISEEWLLARVSGHGDWVEWKTGVEC
ncbi:MAG: DUF2332 domain-containing protein, partial [Oscillochloris sp.]|nr:DUF2332 domain-containing protein [Oscillochloris sp.]